MANRYLHITGSTKIADDYDTINETFDMIEDDVDRLDNRDTQLQSSINQTDKRLDTIIGGSSPTKDPELTDIRTPDPSYTPERTINVAGDMMRDMQKQFNEQLADTTLLVNQKANQAALNETNTIVSNKRDKSTKITNADLDTSSDATKIKLINLSEEVQAAMAGTTPITATVGNGSLTKEKYAIRSISDGKTDFVTTGKNLYDASKMKVGTWASWSTGVIGTLAGWNCSDYIPVLPNTQYATRFGASRAFYTSDYTFISGGDQSSSFTTPANCAYVIINFTDANANGQQLELGSSFTIYEPFYNEFKNGNPNATSIPAKGSITMDKFHSENPLNLFNKDTVEIGYYIAANGAKTAYGNNVGGIGAYIPVTPNQKYTFTNGTVSAGQKLAGAWYDKDKNWISTIDYGVSTPPKIVTTTAPFNARYFIINFVTSNIDNIMFVLGDTYPSTYQSYGVEVDWLKTPDKGFNPSIEKIKEIANYSRFYGGKVNVLGDSITYGAGLSDLTKRYSDLIKNKLGLSVSRNYGINATLITHEDGRTNAFVDRYSAMDNDADLVIVFGGTNDYYVGSGALGEENSTNTSEFYGALNVMIQGLINKYTTKTILFVTPFNSFYVHSTDDPNTSTGVNLKGYRDAILKRCEYYGIPVLDLFSMSGIDAAHNLASRDAYTSDGLHPNEAGHELIANKLVGFIKTL